MSIVGVVTCCGKKLVPQAVFRNVRTASHVERHALSAIAPLVTAVPSEGPPTERSFDHFVALLQMVDVRGSQMAESCHQTFFEDRCHLCRRVQLGDENIVGAGRVQRKR